MIRKYQFEYEIEGKLFADIYVTTNGMTLVEAVEDFCEKHKHEKVTSINIKKVEESDD